jgi:hypothetical protein
MTPLDPRPGIARARFRVGWQGSMLARSLSLAVLFGCAAPAAVLAQAAEPLLYRVFLSDGTGLASFGEWARVEDRVVFSMPLGVAAGPSDLHLVSLPVQRIDMARTERYAESVRAAHYAANRGEADFAQLSGDVAHALNQVALIKDPAARLATAERARRALADWPGAHYGYRAGEVREIVGVLDEVISGLRAQGGSARFDLTLSTTTSEAAHESLLPAPDHAEVVRQLMSAATVVDSPAEKVSLLQSVVAFIDRAVDLLPEAFAKTIRSSALGGIADEQRIDAQYARLRTTTLAEAARYAGSADVRGLERLRKRVREQDSKLGQRRPDDVAGMIATLDAHLDVAFRLRLTHDQWLLRIDAQRAYQRAVSPFVGTLIEATSSLDFIRSLAGPPPFELRPLAQRLSRASRRLALVEPTPELTSVHAVFRSAFSLAENAVQLRLDAAQAADIELAKQAAAAASGAIMLLSRARADLDAALQPPALARPPQP